PTLVLRETHPRRKAARGKHPSLVSRGPDNGRNLVEGAQFIECPGLVRDLEAVDDGLPVDAIWRLDYLQHGLRQRLENLIACLRAHARQDLQGLSAAKRRCKGVPLRRGLRVGRPADRFRIATLYDGAVEKPAARRRDQVQPDAVTAC